MIVRANCRGHVFSGVLISALNVRRYFPRNSSVIELQLDHLLIRCRLTPDFWQGDAEICDPRLAAWLEAKNFNGQRGASPIPLSMIPSGKNAFRLRALTPHPPARPKPRLEPALANSR
jgi:hypothetical protein